MNNKIRNLQVIPTVIPSNFDQIQVKGVFQNNLKNIDVNIPKHKIVVFTGISGSGKSSLVFNTIALEAQRLLFESFNTFARARLPKLSRPDVHEIKNLSPVIIIDQKRLGRNPRSTVGTVTELNTYLRLLFSRCAEPFIGPSFYFSFNNPQGMCPNCNGIGEQFEINIDNLLDWDKSINQGAILHPDYKIGSIYFKLISGLPILDTDKPLKKFSEMELNLLLHAEKTHYEDHVFTQMTSMKYEGVITSIHRRYILNDKKNGPKSKRYKKFFKISTCQKCKGTRVNERALIPKIMGYTIAELLTFEIVELREILEKITHPLAEPILHKFFTLLDNLIEIGAEYLSLSQPVGTLSGGESQRVKIAKQLNSNLVDMIYILDEPTIGLHPNDVNKLITIIKKLRDSGNSVLVIEHDPAIMEIADEIIDIGPKAGEFGGNIVFQGEFSGLIKNKNSITGQFLNQRLELIGTKSMKDFDRVKNNEYFHIKNASKFNLKDISVDIPKQMLCCITGVAGSGKSTLMQEFFIKKYPDTIVIDQSSIYKSSRSIPLTFIGVFKEIRKIFAEECLVKPKFFSFNSDGGCSKCNGMGTIKYEMHFLSDVEVLCDECNGTRYKPHILEMKRKGKNIHDILTMTVDQSIQYFTSSKIVKKLKLLQDVGLNYIQLGQPLSTFSGGECQRLKLALELQKSGKIYFLDEPSTGLHMFDIGRLLTLFRRLVNKGNSVIIIEHNLDIISQADWIIDLGPGGGKNGGLIMAEGTPSQVMTITKSKTGIFLKKYI